MTGDGVRTAQGQRNLEEIGDGRPKEQNKILTGQSLNCCNQAWLLKNSFPATFAKIKIASRCL